MGADCLCACPRGPMGGDMEIDYIVDLDHGVVGRNKFRINVREQKGGAGANA